MSQVIGTKGIRRLIDQVGDESRQQINQTKNADVDVEGSVVVTGDFVYNSKGEIALVGRLAAELDSAESELDPVTLDIERGGAGDGTVTVTFKVKMHKSASIV